MASDAPSAPSSKRWTQFYAALQLAIQRAAHKWTFEDFAESFPLWSKEQPKGTEAVFHTVSSFVENYIVEQSNKLFEEYNVQPNVDRLHAVVTSARARKQSGEVRGDVWREDLEPRAAVRARTVPVLEKERDRLRAQLAEMESQNMQLQAVVEQNVKARKEADAKREEIFAFLDEVYEKWNALPLEEMQSWTLQTAETQTGAHPS